MSTPPMRRALPKGSQPLPRRRHSRGHISPSAAREAAAVGLICLGAMTLLSLLSFYPTDISLNASGTAEVRNWIGPAGAYWADLLLQAVGIGAWALSGLLLLAGCRAFAGRVIVPGPREAIGGLLLMVCLATLGQLLWRGHEQAYAPGGVAGALMAEVLWQHFAGLGAYLLAISLSLVAFSMTAEGVLSGWGVAGFSVARSMFGHSRTLAGYGRRQMGGALARARAQRQRRAQAAMAQGAQTMPLPHAQTLQGPPLSDAIDFEGRGALPFHEATVDENLATYALGEPDPSILDDVLADGLTLNEADDTLADDGFSGDGATSPAHALGRNLRWPSPREAPVLPDYAPADAPILEQARGLVPQLSLSEQVHALAADAADAPAEDFVFFDEVEPTKKSVPTTDLLAATPLAAVVGAATPVVSAAVPPGVDLTAASPIAAPPVAASSIAASPVATSSIAASPVAALSTAASSIAASPVAASSIAASPVAASSIAASPTAAPPTAASPTAASPIAAAPIIDVRPKADAHALGRVVAAKRPQPAKKTQYILPSDKLLDYVAAVRVPIDPARLQENAERLVKTLMDYGIEGHVREIRPGPVVTMYEYVPGPGIKISKIASLADDLAMSMEAMRVRIVAPIPGKGAVGIEIPNDDRETVYLKEIIAHDTFHGAKSPLTMALGKDIEGNAYVADLARMPHLLVAGATGAGKSVSINAMIMSVLFKATPDEVRMLMVDPKMLELSVYEGIPHLLLPVVTDPKKAALALRWATEEMERRYELLAEVGVRGIDGYNAKVRDAAARGEQVTVAGADKDGPRRICEPMPYLLVIVDELADLMMVASREVESSIMRLAQMARAAGIHLILATQRPSVDVLTGVIKANFPTRIAFQVASRHDSRTIIDGNGAEHLLGRGDMLYLSPGVGGIKRVHGAYVSEAEIERAVAFVRSQGTPQYDESILAARVDEGDTAERAEALRDDMYDQAVAIVAETRQASISMIQRRLRIGYNRAARMVERMELEGVVGPADGAKAREVLVGSMSAP